MKKLLMTVLLLNLTACSTMAKIGFICAGAVGAQYNKQNRVLYAYKGSPAEKMGIKRGDWLVEPEKFSGLPGDKVTVRWITEDKELTVLHSKEAILECVEDIQERDYYIVHSW